MVDLLHSIKTFYLLEEIEGKLLFRRGNFRRAEEKLHEDFSEYRRSFNTNLSSLLFDYLTIAVIGEGRHGRHASPPFDMYIGYVSLFGERGRLGAAELPAYNRVKQLHSKIHPKAALSWLLMAFLDRKWPNLFGGSAWADIAKTALLHGSAPHCVFIDTVINLEHNTGSCLNKKIGLFENLSKEPLSDFLNDKADRAFSFFPSDNTFLSLPVESTLRRIIQRMIVLNILQEVNCTEQDLLRHAPYNWGRITPTFIEGDAQNAEKVS